MPVALLKNISFGLTYQKISQTEKSHTNFNEAIRLFNKIEAPKQVEKVEKAKKGNMVLPFPL
ncbi:hypothetical protein BMF77_00395 [Dolichospermum sp. UHCC 0315A]|uniref:hypothetical protein n=1 Tax=Dolichospermum sp. UHCC 0315A TaxID=1914871 RepID=UPI0011E72A9B|nr:hypothetical protein [Dolichospermum sp. UHCC 0315A]QEI39842.1 hypothetical protein BMF77_00395 [Dolichospermum sp. UHCC 0315A]